MNMILALLLFSSTLPALSPGQAAPAFSVRDLNGRTWTQKGASKGCLLVDFWASWCVPCVQEIPALNALKAEYGTSGALEVLGLSLDKGGPAAVRGASARLRIAYPTAPVDPTVAEAYGILGFPSAYLLRDGKILKVLTGRRALADFERDLGPFVRKP